MTKPQTQRLGKVQGCPDPLGKLATYIHGVDQMQTSTSGRNQFYRSGVPSPSPGGRQKGRDAQFFGVEWFPLYLYVLFESNLPHVIFTILSDGLPEPILLVSSPYCFSV